METLLKKVKVKDIMILKVPTIDVDDEMSRAMEIFVAHAIHYLPVVDKDKKIVGLLSLKHLYRIQSPRKVAGTELAYDRNMILDGDSYFNKEVLNSHRIRGVMHKVPTTVLSEAFIAQAILTMSEKKVGCLIVVNGTGAVEGMLTSQEIIDFIAQLLKT